MVRAGVFCLLCAGGDGCADELECAALGCCGLGEDGHGGSVGAVAQVVAAQGGQVGEQAAEAVLVCA